MLPRTTLKAEITNTDNGSSRINSLDVIVSKGNYIIEVSENLITVSKENLIKLINYEDETIGALEVKSK